MNYGFLKTEAMNDSTVQRYLNKSVNDIDLRKGFEIYMQALKAGGGHITKDVSSSSGGTMAAEGPTYINAVKQLSSVLGKFQIMEMKSDTRTLSEFVMSDELVAISENGETTPRSTSSFAARTLNTTLLGKPERFSHKWIRNSAFRTIGEALTYIQARQFQATLNGMGKLALLATGSTGQLGLLSDVGVIGHTNEDNASQLTVETPITGTAGTYTAQEVTQSGENLISAIDQKYVEAHQNTEKWLFCSPVFFESQRIQNKNSVLAAERFLATPNEMVQGMHTLVRTPHLQSSSSLVYSVEKGNLVAGIGMGGDGFSPRFAINWDEDTDSYSVWHKVDFDVQVGEISGSILGLLPV